MFARTAKNPFKTGMKTRPSDYQISIPEESMLSIKEPTFDQLREESKTNNAGLNKQDCEDVFS